MASFRSARIIVISALIVGSVAGLSPAKGGTTSGRFAAPYSKGEACFSTWHVSPYCVRTRGDLITMTDRHQLTARLAALGHLFVDQFQIHESQRRGTETWGGYDRVLANRGHWLYRTSLDQYIGVAPSNGTIDVSAEIDGHYISREWSTGFQICLQLSEEYLVTAGQDCISDGETVGDLHIEDAPIVAGKKYWILVVMNDLGDSSSGYVKVPSLNYTITT